jgi:hypothetical protein
MLVHCLHFLLNAQRQMISNFPFKMIAIPFEKVLQNMD